MVIKVNNIPLKLTQEQFIEKANKVYNNKCKRTFILPFDFYLPDFYLPDFNLLIEYQGRQHYEKIDFFEGKYGLKYRQENDRIKREFCYNNKINLLEIKYTDDIFEKLQEVLNG
jgi:Rad3-related DNA helicase